MRVLRAIQRSNNSSQRPKKYRYAKVKRPITVAVVFDLSLPGLNGLYTILLGSDVESCNFCVHFNSVTRDTSSLRPTPNLSQEVRHVDFLGLHLRHPRVFHHSPGGGPAGGIFLEAGIER